MPTARTLFNFATTLAALSAGRLLAEGPAREIKGTVSSGNYFVWELLAVLVLFGLALYAVGRSSRRQ